VYIKVIKMGNFSFDTQIRFLAPFVKVVYHAKQDGLRVGKVYTEFSY